MLQVSLTIPDGSISQRQVCALYATQSHDGCAQVAANLSHHPESDPLWF